jgi:LysM repeat protein
VARTTPVVDVGVGPGAAIAGLAADRRAWQAIPAIAVAALAALGLGLGRDEPATGALPTSTPTAVPSRSSVFVAVQDPARHPSPAPSGSLTASATPSASLAPTPAPTTTPGATARTSYTVKRGDTLYGIAGAFNTTVAAIKELNGLTSNTLHAGQVLLIP